MLILKRIDEYRDWRKKTGLDITIGFVPTMGSLHKGHESLIEMSKKENDKTVVSIFINPIQFDNPDDLNTYPQNLEKDIHICESKGVDVLFYPKAEEMYHPGHSTFCLVENLDLHLCGASRPGHFRGVSTVVLKLFNIIEADTAYFGQKDIQQAAIIKKMVKDLNLNIQIKTLPTIREPSGLALSSRNLKLSSDQINRASAIHRGLRKAEEACKNGTTDSDTLLKIVETEILSSRPDKIDYISLVDLDTLQPVQTVKAPSVLAAAVYYGEVRLIDNKLLARWTKPCGAG